MEKSLIDSVLIMSFTQHPFLWSVEAWFVNGGDSDEQGIVASSPLDTQFQDAPAGGRAVQTGENGPQHGVRSRGRRSPLSVFPRSRRVCQLDDEPEYFDKDVSSLADTR